MTAEPILREDHVTPVSFAMAELRAELDATEAKIDALLEAERQDAIRRHPSNYRCDDPGCGLADPSRCGKCRPKLRLVKEGDHA